MTTERMNAGTSPCWNRRRPHRGVVALWTLLVIPVLLVMFAVVVEGVHLWLARVELENALESAALAAVKEWAETGGSPASGWTSDARDVGVEYAAANTINSTPVGIDTNIGVFADPGNLNENLSCGGTLIFGAITQQNPYVFEADVAPSCAGEATGFAVRAQATHTVPSLICNFLGINFGGPFEVSACTTAMYDCELQRPRLIRVEPDNFYCP